MESDLSLKGGANAVYPFAVAAQDCDAFNNVFDATESSQVWVWNEDTQTCEAGS